MLEGKTFGAKVHAVGIFRISNASGKTGKIEFFEFRRYLSMLLGKVDVREEPRDAPRIKADPCACGARSGAHDVSEANAVQDARESTREKSA